MNAQLPRGGLRHARKSIRSAALLIRGADVWSTDLEDISATGVMVARPSGWNGQLGHMYALDMIIGEDLNIHVDATVARITERHIGFAYARIPPDKEVPLWDLLGGYADRLEQFED
jgi:PilZ domain